VKLFRLLKNNKIGNIITIGKVIGKLYQLDLTVVKTTERSLVKTTNKVFTTINTTKDVDYLLHQRFGHISEKAIQALKRTVICNIITQKDQINNNTTINNKSIKECPVCAKANIRQSINKISENKNNNNLKYLQKVRSNLVGPINPPTYDKKKYVITFLDSKTKFLEVELLSSKDQATEAFQRFKIRCENQESTGNKRIKIVATDEGTEYTGKRFQYYLIKDGINHQTSSPYTKE